MATNYNYFGNLVTNGLVLDLDAAKLASYPGSGTTWYDISGNNNNGTLTNGPTFSGIGKQAAIVFDGVNDYIDISNTSALNPPVMSISAWFNLSTLVTNQNIISKGYTSLASPYISYTLKMYDLSPYNTIQMQASIGGTIYLVTSATTLTTNTWYSVVGTYDGNIFKLYINGVQDANTTSISGSITSYNTPVQVGRWGTQGSQYLNGKVALAQIYNRALSATEVQQNFNALRGRYGI